MITNSEYVTVSKLQTYLKVFSKKKDLFYLTRRDVLNILKLLKDSPEAKKYIEENIK